MRVLLGALIVVGSLLVACGNDKSNNNSDGASAATSHSKSLLTAWYVANQAWGVRLDVGGANRSGTPFTLVFKFSDTTETQCTGTMTGSEASGTYDAASCVDAGTGMSDSVGGAVFETGGVGSYTNDGSTLSLCKANTSCLEYY